MYGFGSSTRGGYRTFASLEAPHSNSYNPNRDITLKQAARATIGTAARESRSNSYKHSPDPTAYYPQSGAFGGPRFIIGKKLVKSIERSPGAGDYDPQYEHLQSCPPAYTLAQSLKLNGPDVRPGPGSYDQNLSQLPSAPKYGFGSGDRERKRLKQTGPGPGDYKLINTVGDVPDYAIPNRKAAHKFV